MKNKLLKLCNIKKIFHTEKDDVLAIDNLSFDIYENEFVSVVGPSGCGKSTILSILSGLEKQTDGNIYFFKDTAIGYMPQNDCLFEWRTILENALLGLEITKKLTKENIDYVKSLLKAYGLDEFSDKHPSSLSGGMRQRVALIRTLALKPDILLLDEPMSALDSQTRMAIGEDIFNIIKQEGKSVIMVTHDISEAISMSDRIIVLSKRPGVIKSIYNINIDGDTLLKKRKHKKFSLYYEKIWKDLDINE